MQNDITAIVKTTVDFLETVPYEHDIFLNLIGPRRGGLEYKNATLMISEIHTPRSKAKYHD